MKYIVNDKVVLSRAPEGPLAAHIGSFTDWVSEQGYASSSRWERVHLAACFSGWLGKQGVGLRSISSEHPAQYLRHRSRRLQPGRSDAAALRDLMGFLRRQEVIPAEKQPSRRPTQVEECVGAYERYLSEERALASATIVNYAPFIRSFLDDRFGNRRVTLGRLCAGDVVRFVRHAAQRLHMKRAKLLTSALRSFLQYARYRGDITLDLAAAVQPVANWSMTSIPRAIPANQVRQLLASINRPTAIGRRDYAILLLLARLGLRSCEVAFLELDDIDWEAGRFSVRGKGGRQTELPLPNDVGKAIVEYLQHGRPQTTQGRRDAVLLSILYDTGARVQELIDLSVGDVRLDPPAQLRLLGKGRKMRAVPLMESTVQILRDYIHEKHLDRPDQFCTPLFQNANNQRLSRSGIRYILQKYLIRARSECPTLNRSVSPHCFRHSKGMHLLQSGISLEMIRDFLGHVDVKTTQIYARANLEMKRKALEKISDPSPVPTLPSWQQNKDLLDWLRSL